MCGFSQGHKYDPPSDSYDAVRPRLTESHNIDV